MLTWGLIFGFVTAGTYLAKVGEHKPLWLNNWFRPWGRKGEAGFIRRTKIALSRKNHLYTFPLFMPMGMFLGAAGVAVFLLNIGSASFFWGALLGITGTASLGYAIDFKQRFHEYRQSVSIIAAQKLVRRLKPADSNAILVPLTQSPDRIVRIAAAMGLRELGTKEGGEALRALCEDNQEDVAASARNAYSDLQQVYRGESTLSVRTMETYAKEHQYLLKLLRKGKKRKSQAADYEKLAEISRQMDEIVFSQLPLRRAYPDVLCRDCYTRGIAQRYEEWEWVQCRLCKEVHGLKPNVKTVVGQIGGQQAWHLQDGKLQINLWDESNRKAQAADLDVLEIIGGDSINYNWAVSALLDKLHNQSLGIGSRVQVRLVDAPPLEANTLRLLQLLDPTMVGHLQAPPLPIEGLEES